MTSLDQIDRDSQLIRAATIGELEEAFSIIGRGLRSRSEQMLLKALGDKEYMMLGAGVERPFNEARYHSLIWREITRGISGMVSNDIEAFKVIYNTHSPKTVFIQSCAIGAKGSYYVIGSRITMLCEEPAESVSYTKSAANGIGSRTHEAIQGGRLVTPPEIERPMLEVVRVNLGYRSTLNS